LASTDEPRSALSSLSLPFSPVSGVTIANGLAYVLQLDGNQWTNILSTATNLQVVVVGGTKENPIYATNREVVTNWTSVPLPAVGELTILSKTNDTLALVGQVTFTNVAGTYGSEFQPHWPSPGVLAWSPQAREFLPLLPILPVGVAGGVRPAITPRSSGDGSAIPDLFGYYGSMLILPFDVSTPAAPVALPTVNLSTNAYDSGEGGVFAQSGLVFSGRSSSYYLPPLLTNGDGTITTNVNGYGVWRTDHFVDVVDFADPTHPTVRPPTALPGALTGVAHGGAMVFAVGPNLETASGWTNYLYAAAYDGVTASVVASTPIPDVSLGFWPGWFSGSGPILARPVWFGYVQAEGPVVESDGTVWLVRQGQGTNAVASVEAWAVTAPGEFAKVGAVGLSGIPQGYHFFGQLLVVTEGSSAEFVDASAPASPVVAGSAEIPCSLSWDWNISDAGVGPVAWIARNANGLWEISVTGP
jgi:hypothetical protein